MKVVVTLLNFKSDLFGDCFPRKSVLGLICEASVYFLDFTSENWSPRLGPIISTRLSNLTQECLSTYAPKRHKVIALATPLRIILEIKLGSSYSVSDV